MISARFAGPEILEQGKVNALICALYQNGALIAPASGGSCSVYRADGTLVETGSAIVSSSIATFSTSALSSETRGEGWRVSWSLTVGGEARIFDRMAALCRRRLFPVVTDADLYRKHSDLATLRASSQASYQSKIDDCWEELIHDVRQKGSIPHLVMSPEDLKFVLLYRVLASIYYEFGTGQQLYIDRAAHYRDLAKQAYDGLSFVYDSTDSGKADAAKRSAQPVTMLCDPGSGWGGYGRHDR